MTRNRTLPSDCHRVSHLVGTVTLAVCLLLLASCRQQSSQPSSSPRVAFLQDLGIDVTDDMVLTHRLTLPDQYITHAEGDSLTLPPMVELTREQYERLIAPAGDAFHADMATWRLMGVRDVDGNHTLVAYYVGSTMGYSVYFMTYDSVGNLCDAIDLRELHVLWPVNHEEAGQCPVRTLDSEVTFAGKRHFTLHRLMGDCDMDYDRDLKGAPQWQLAWDQDYDITDDGLMVLKEQRETSRKGDVDPYAEVIYRSWDLLVASQHDTTIMNVWNGAVQRIEDLYAPDNIYSPLKWNVPKLYNANPQRFLRWMASHRGASNRLLRYATVQPDNRQAVLEQINAIDDADARNWLTRNLMDADTVPQASK